jgi:hypothetical protein
VKLIDLDPTKDIVVATMAKVRDAEPKSDDKDMLQQMEQEMLQNEEE